MKKIFSTALLIVTAITLVGCKTETSKLFEFENKESIMAFQAVSSVDVIQSEQLDLETTDNTLETNVTEEQVEAIRTVSPYIDMFENLLTKSDGFSVETKTSDLEDYEFMQVFLVPNMAGDTDTYVMYYNITDQTLEDDASENDADDDYDDDDDIDTDDNDDNDENEEIESTDDETNANEDIDEIAFEFEGILRYNDQTYDVFGKQEVEADELELEFITMIDDNNYVIVKYEVESETLEFEYEVYQDGQKVSEFKIEFENELDELEIEFEYKSNNTYGKYEFELETKDEKTILKIEFETTIDGVFTKGKAYYLVTYDVDNNPHYEVVFSDSVDDELED
ncbi:MAG: hypothetical protein WCZ19_04395 [Acholeplasma sp.]